MPTLLSRSAWAKISVFRKKWPFSPSKRIYIGLLARIRNQRLGIDPCAKFQLHWTKDKGTRILTWNDTKNGLMTSYLPSSNDVSKILWRLRHFAKFGCNWTTNKGETMCPPAYMVPEDPSLNRVKACNHQMKSENFGI